MEPLFDTPPPFWRVNKETGYAELVADPRELFYHDLPKDEADYWVGQLKTQSLKALFEGGEHVHAGWQDVLTWYIGTIEDKGLPVVLQRVQVGAARAQGVIVHHKELRSSHSSFLSLPESVVDVILDAVDVTNVSGAQPAQAHDSIIGTLTGHLEPRPRSLAPITWLRFGLPLAVGHLLGWSYWGFTRLRKLWIFRGRSASFN